MNGESMLIARICHDLITPLNAISLGFEAFQISRDEDLMDCIRESVQKTNVIMKFIRELFSERCDTFCYSQFFLKQITSDYLKLDNISFDLKSDMDNIASIAGKIVMYMAVIAKETIPFGGSVVVKISDASCEIVTRCSGKSISIPEINIEKNLNHKNIIRYKLLSLLKESEIDIKAYKDGQDVVFQKKLII